MTNAIANANRASMSATERTLLGMIRPDGTPKRGGDVVRSHLAKLDDAGLDRLKGAIENEPNFRKRAGMGRWLGGEIAGERRIRARRDGVSAD